MNVEIRILKHGTIFLSILRPNKTAATTTTTTTVTNDNSHNESLTQPPTSNEETTIAKYTFGYSEESTRIANDQKLKINKIRAVFCSDVSSPCHTAGLPSLLLNLSEHGSSDVSLVGPINFTGTFGEGVVDAILGARRLYPKVTCCEVPSSSGSEEGLSAVNESWWKVYEDECILVHAREDIGSSNTNKAPVTNGCPTIKIVYLISIPYPSSSKYGTITKSTNRIQHYHSFAIAPNNQSKIQPLPAFMTKKHSKYDEAAAPPLDFLLYLNTNTKHKGEAVLDKNSIIAKRIFTQTPKSDYWDSSNNHYNILLRASNLSRILHQLVPASFPLFSYSNTSAMQQELTPSSPKTLNKRPKVEPSLVTSIRPGQSIRLWDDTIHPLNYSVSFGVQDHHYCNTNKSSLNMIQSHIQNSTTDTVLDIMNKIKINSNANYRNHVQNNSSISDNKINKCSKNYNQDITSLPLLNDEHEIDLDDDTNSTDATNTVITPHQPHDNSEAIYQNTPTNCKNNDILDTDENEISLDDDENEISLDDDNDSNDDDNEISIDDDDNDNDDNRHQITTNSNSNENINININTIHSSTEPKVLILGTGCSSPSPLRGSSSIALLLPIQTTSTNKHIHTTHSLTALFDCGEGTLTSLSKYLSTSSLTLHFSTLTFIWISHAHLDHYGGLPSLLHTLYHTVITNGMRKLTSPPIVIAPTKVLRYLDLILNAQSYSDSTHKQQSPSYSKYYIGVTHNAFQYTPSCQYLRDLIIPNHPTTPFFHLQSIPVQHCTDSYALLLGLSIPTFTNQQPFFICYSGDAKASNSKYLIQACHNKHISLLLHESTFDDDERGISEANKKRHSTVLEALHFANIIQANACVLTHFSNRYCKYYFPDHLKYAIWNRSSSNNPRHCILVDEACQPQFHDNSSIVDSWKLFPNVKYIGAALDGMLVSISEPGYKLLSLVSELVIDILSCDATASANNDACNDKG